MPVNSYVLRSAICAALAGLLFGFDTAVVSGTTAALVQKYHLSAGALGFTVASALWGTVVGALFAGRPGDIYGRRASLKALGILYLVSSIGCAFAWQWSALVVFRFISGLAIGGSSVLGPMYIAEIAPAKSRGRLVALFQCNVVFGILVAYLSNFLVGQLNLGAIEWRVKLAVPAIPAIVFFLMLFTIPESPRWLVRKDRNGEAKQILEAISPESVESELADIQASIVEEQVQSGARLFARGHSLPIFLAVAVAMFNQLAGINAILYYLNDIFQRSGFSKVSSDIQSVIVGATFLAFTIAAMSVIDKFGRKFLLLFGAIGTCACLSAVAFIFYTGTHGEWLLWLLIVYIAFFGFSQGTVIWVYISEIFPNAVRAKGQSLGSFTHWSMDALIAGLYPLFAASSPAAPFVFFAGCTLLQFFVVLFVFPETKGISLEEMQHRLGSARRELARNP